MKYDNEHAQSEVKRDADRIVRALHPKTKHPKPSKRWERIQRIVADIRRDQQFS